MTSIRISDLRTPLLTPAQADALAAAERQPVDLSVSAVLSAAAEAEGQDDFGPADFTERMGLWLAEVDADDNRTALCRTRLLSECIRLARNRLRVIDLLRQHPEIHDIEIRQPVIVVGMPGTE